jgi:hypothetical protein
MTGYWKKGEESPKGVDPDDDYEMPEGRIPAVAMCSVYRSCDSND